MTGRPSREFYFRLAGHLGCTVAELLARITSRELSEWMAYEQVAGPLGGRRIDHAAALITSAVLNANRGKGQPRRSPEQLLPEWGRPRARRRMGPDEMWTAAQAANAKLGGTVRAA